METKMAAQAASKGHQFQKMAAAITAAASLTKIATYDVRALEFLFIGITTATASLTEFQINAAANVAGTLVDISSTSGLGITWQTATLDTLAAGTHAVGIDVRGIATIEIQCKSGGTATVLLEAGGN